MSAESNRAERIDWSQLWYPGPARTFTPAEMARGGGDRPSRTFSVVLAINVALLTQGILQLAPPTLTARLTALLVAFAVMAWQGSLALWRSPTRKRLAWLMSLTALAFVLFALGFKWRVPDRTERDWLLYTMGAILGMMTLGFWFVAVFRAHQISARLTELDERERNAAMRAQLLQAQIQPHFLFNSLASLQQWVETGDGRAAPMLRSLTGFLRASLPLFDRPLLSVAEEAEVVRRYLEVMQARLGARLCFEIDIAPAAGSAQLPPAVLLTLVENAVEHGVQARLSGGLVQLCARVDAQEILTVEVRDNGPGLTEPAGSGSVGLRNTRARLEQAFGGRASLELCNLPDGGCLARVTVRVTMRPADANTINPHTLETLK